MDCLDLVLALYAGLVVDHGLPSTPTAVGRLREEARAHNALWQQHLLPECIRSASLRST